MFALEQMALAQQTMFRAASLESGIFVTFLDMALNHDGTPFTPMSPELIEDCDMEIARAQNQNYALADGFHRLARKDNTFPLFLRYKVQTERLYRRAVEEFDRLKKLRPEFPNEPILETQPEGNEQAYVPHDDPFQRRNRTRSRTQPSTPQARRRIPRLRAVPRMLQKRFLQQRILQKSMLQKRMQQELWGRPPGLRPAPWPASPFPNDIDVLEHQHPNPLPVIK